VAANPPTFSSSKVISSRYRFEANAAQSGTVIGVEDVAELLVMATAANAAYRICSGTRIRSISMWGPMASDLKPVTLELEYSASPGSGAGPGAPSTRVTATSMGSMKAASLRYAPPVGSLASLWLDQSISGSLFKLSCPANTIIDILLDQQVLNDTSPAAVGAAVAGATVGQVYVRALDSNGSVQLIPVGYPTI